MSADRNRKAVHRIADGLTNGAGDDTETREQVVRADNPQGGNADTQHFVRRIKNTEKLVGYELKQKHSDKHDSDSRHNRKLYRTSDTLTTLCAVVVGDDRYHAIVQSEHRHEYEALKLEIRPENRGCGRREADENLVHSESHD